MNTITSVVKRHSIVMFFALAYTFAWLPWVLGTLVPASRPFVLYPFLGSGPLLAALVVIPITQGRSGLRALGARMLKWRVGWHWYAVAIGIPLLVALSAAALNFVFGATGLSLASTSPCPINHPSSFRRHPCQLARGQSPHCQVKYGYTTRGIPAT